MVESACYPSSTCDAACSIKARYMPLTVTGWERQHGVGGIPDAARPGGQQDRQKMECRLAKLSHPGCRFLCDIRSTTCAQPGGRFRIFTAIRRDGKIRRGWAFTRRSHCDTRIPDGGMRCATCAMGTPQENSGDIPLSHSRSKTSGKCSAVYSDTRQNRKLLRGAQYHRAPVKFHQ